MEKEYINVSTLHLLLHAPVRVDLGLGVDR